MTAHIMQERDNPETDNWRACEAEKPIIDPAMLAFADRIVTRFNQNVYGWRKYRVVKIEEGVAK